MPSSITHQLIAEEALNYFPPAARDAVNAAPDEYYLGAQGPDVFFFYRIGSKKEYNLGKFMHRYRVYDVFGLFRRLLMQDGKDGRVPRLNEEERKQAFAYVLGFITHYAADGNFHPYVYRYLQKAQAKKIVHQQMENDWDVYFLRRLRGKEAENFSYAFSAETVIAHRTVARIYAFLAENLERDEIKERKFRRGVRNFNRYLRFFHKKCYRSHSRWERTENLLHLGHYLSALYPRENPDPAFLSGDDFAELSEDRGKNADELFDRAVGKSAHLSELFLRSLDGDPLARDDFGRGLLTGNVL